MASKNLVIKLRNSSVANSVPSSLAIGEPAINLVDQKLYTSNGTNVFQLAASMSDIAGLATTVSPALTGTPTTPTAAVNTNTTQIASTAFVLAQAANVAPVADGAAAVGTSTRFARQDHVHPTDPTLAPIASPTFTGTANSPTPTVDNNSTQIATTAFVLNQGANATPIVDGTAAIGSATRWARQDHVHPTDTSRAALASPAFTGTPTGPTAGVGTNTTQLATTAFVLAQAASAAPLIDGTAAVGTSTSFARQDHVHPTDTTRAPLASPALTGVPTAPTPANTDNSNTVSTTSYVTSAVTNSATTVNAAIALKANIASPTFTGVAAAPTATVDTNTTQLATTAFVLAQAANATPTALGTAAVGTSTRFARQDHVHPTDTTRAPLVSPAFTGTPTAPTTANSDSSTSLATTNFVQNWVTVLVAADALKAPLSSAALIGVPTAPTAATGTNTTQLATTAFVQQEVSAAKQGLDVKDSVRALAIVNVSLTSPGATIDTVTMNTGDRVMLTAQTTGSQNGIYIWNGASSAMTRSIDANTSAKVTPGMYTFVEEGANADSGWVLNTDGPITLDTTSLAFTQFSGAGSITAGANLTKTGSVLAVQTSPSFTGTPLAPTATAGANTTQIATTAFVAAAFTAYDFDTINGGTY